MTSYQLEIVGSNSEYFCDVGKPFNFSEKHWSSDNWQEHARKAIKQAGITRAYNESKEVEVNFYSFEVVKGKLNKKFVTKKFVEPYAEPMNEVQYNYELKELLADIPTEFHGFVDGMAWDGGHSAGYEECLTIAQNIIVNLEPAIKAFKQSLNK